MLCYIVMCMTSISFYTEMHKCLTLTPWPAQIIKLSHTDDLIQIPSLLSTLKKKTKTMQPQGLCLSAVVTLNNVEKNENTLEAVILTDFSVLIKFSLNVRKTKAFGRSSFHFWDPLCLVYVCFGLMIYLSWQIMS